MNHADKYADLKKDIVKWFKDSHETYGYRRIFLLAQQAGYPYCMETIRRIMHQELGLCPTIYNQRRRKYSSYRGNIGKIAPNLLNQHFDTTEPYRVLHTDITQIRMENGNFGYISAVLDNSATSVLIHSDQGWHYQLAYYRNELKQHHLIQSMSRKGNCHDNAPMESFFNLLKRECLKRTEIKNINQLQQKVKNYVGWYNTKRISFKLNGMSPCQYRQKKLATVNTITS